MDQLIEVTDTSKIILKEGEKYKITKTFTGEVTGVDIDERSITHLITTDAVDRYNDIVEPKGGHFKNFTKNNIVLNAHNYWSLPIATNLWLRDHKNGILAKTQFHDKTQMARDTFELAKEGILKAWSIGFIPLVWESFDDERGKGYHYKEWELLEYSLVTVPANPEALTLAMDKGILIDPKWKSIIKDCKAVDNSNNNEGIDMNGLKQLEERVVKLEGQLNNYEENMAAFQSNAVEEANKNANESLEAIVEKIPELVGESIEGVVRRITGKPKGDE